VEFCTYMNNYKTWVKTLQWNFQLQIALYRNQISQISLYKKMRLSPYYFNPIILFWFLMTYFFMSKIKCFPFQSWFYKYMFKKKNIGIKMKCSFILIILLFSFHVIGGGKFRRHFIEKMCQFAYIVPNWLKRISQL